ncbi:tricorn protease [Wenjunlia tyrosinilytica]|uniref:Tricorn protease homolog n=1 Tax=Wenjunlia tyrosinilytica TaxID=1544741 RepID=A0A918DYN5_9ACTN|nr:tricorn protease [Wenjunlia tyrosinilytica]
MTPGAYLRYPHLNGDLLVFVAEDDIWLTETTGKSRAWRLTADRTRVGHPRLSPDGGRVAFTSWRSLDSEVYAVPVDGGQTSQLTYWGSVDASVRGWTPDGRILATSSHAQPFSHYEWAYTVPVSGGPGERLPWGPVADLMVTGRHTLLLCAAAPHEPASWKRYRGGATGRLWLDLEPLLHDLGGHFSSPMLVGERVAFLCDHEGIGNLYSCRPDGTDLHRHTDHADFYARHASTDGQRVVYQCAGEVWMHEDLTDPAGRPRRLDIELGGPRTGRRPYQVPAGSYLQGLACDRTGRASAVCVRGGLYWLTHRDGPARVIQDTPGVRVRLPEMLGSTGRVAWISDAEGEDGIEVAELPGRAERAATSQGEPQEGEGPRSFASGRLGRALEMASSPDGATLAVASNDGRLLLVDVGDGEVTELVRSDNGPVRGLSFSPDSAWLTWSQPTHGRSLSRIMLAKLDDGYVAEATTGRFEDERPVFTRDGKYLAFLSWRGFDPVYDVHTGDYSFPLGSRPYLIPLSSSTPSPFALPVEGRPPSGGLDPAETGDAQLTVDLEGLDSRVTPFPVSASKYSSLTAVQGGLVWMRWPISGALGETFANPSDTSGRPALEYFDLAKGARVELMAHLDWFAVSGDGRRIVACEEGSLGVIPANERDPDAVVLIDLRRILHEVDPAAEWRQSYDEAGRIMRHYFWAEDMCGVPWDDVLDQYRPLVEKVASPDEFADLLREVFGELGTSHAYVTPARRNEGPAAYQRPIGLLGADFARDEEGDWRLTRILPGESSDPRARSPLAGARVHPGDTLTHVDGRPVQPGTGPWPLLAGAGGTTVELTFRSATSGRALRIAVVPLIDERPLRYQDWVAERRAVVRELSGGDCGYLHIPDMGGSGWAQFNRDLRVEMTRPSLIVDVRGNAGGHISELVVEKLSRKIIGWDATRNAQPVSYASDAPRGPLVAVADYATSSDGDMITAAVKLLGIGPVVGSRTWGGVVGMTGRHGLGDGTVITVPMNAAWFEAYGWGVENHGVEPDIEVQRTPKDWAEGRHIQLAAAVHKALELLETHPVAAPPDLSSRADRRRPPLPPRS